MSTKGRQPITVHGQPSKHNFLAATALLAEQKRIRALLDRHNRVARVLNQRKQQGT